MENKRGTVCRCEYATLRETVIELLLVSGDYGFSSIYILILAQPCRFFPKPQWAVA